MVGGGLYGVFKALTVDGMTGGDRLSGLLVGFTYLPVIGAFGAGIAGGANLSARASWATTASSSAGSASTSPSGGGPSPAPPSSPSSWPADGGSPSA